MPERVPWDQIARPDKDYNVLLVGSSRTIPVYWGKDANGQNLLIVELSGNHSAQYKQDRVSVSRIGVDLRQKVASPDQHLVLVLERLVDQDLFYALCRTLIASLDSVSEPVVALAVSLNHLKRWKAFLAGRDPRIMTPEQVRGLFAELMFLRYLLDGRLSEIDAVTAWCGADRVQQDFIFGDTAVEIKSLNGKERNSVRISSEDQLESLTSNLFLNILRLSEAVGAPAALSLNALIAQIEVGLSEALAIERLAASLAAYGYVPLLDYDTPNFVVSSAHAYRVEGAFPRLVRSQLVKGLARVSYDIELESIAAFECNVSEIFLEA